MTCRAIIWCGAITNPRAPSLRPRKTERRRDKALHHRPAVERAIFQNDIELAIQAAHHRQVRPENVWAFVCDRDLLPEDFAGQVHHATVAALGAAITTIAQIATADDHLIFIATNHGVPEGLLVESKPFDDLAEDVDEPVLLSPERLQQSLDTIPGQQIVVIGACYAGIFLPLANACRAILAVCGAQKTYGNDREPHPPRNHFLYELLSRWAGVSLANLAVPERVPMAKAFLAIKADFDGCDSSGDARWPD